MNYGLLLLGEHAPDHVIRLARLAEAHGFQDFWFADEKFYRDPFVSLTHTAHATTTICLGTCVTDPFTRHPAVIAMAAATMAEVSGGRAVLGLGAGFSGLEAMGVRRGKTVRSLRTAIDAIRRLWAGETVSLEDEAFVLHDVQLDFPARRDIPILLASSGKQVLRLAGEMADEVMLGDLGSDAVLAPALAEVERGAAKAGRSVGTMNRIARLNLVLSDDLEAARQAVRPWILAFLWHTYPDWSRLLDYTPDWEERLQPLKDFIAAGGRASRAMWATGSRCCSSGRCCPTTWSAAMRWPGRLRTSWTRSARSPPAASRRSRCTRRRSPARPESRVGGILRARPTADLDTLASSTAAPSGAVWMGWAQPMQPCTWHGAAS